MNGFMAALRVVSELGNGGLEYALAGTAGAALLAAMVLAINLLARRWISAAQMGVLWGLVLVRLLVPWGPPSALSVQNFVRPDADAPVQPATIDVVVVPTGMQTTATLPSTAMHAAPAGTSLLDALWDLLPVAWLCAAVVALGWTTMVHWRWCRRVNRVAPCTDERLLRLRDACCREAGVRRMTTLVLFDGVAQPAVMGLFRPLLLLPPGAASLNEEQLRLIMLHELGHVRRHDLAVNWVLVVLRAVYWWNPLYWLAASRFGSLREQACDAFVMQRAGQPTRAYSELLLTLAQGEPASRRWRVTLPASMLGLFFRFRNSDVRRRLKALPSAAMRQNRWHAVAVAALIALVAASGLTDAKPPQPADSTDWVPRATIDKQTWRVAGAPDEGPRVTRVYDVSKPLARLAAEMKIDAARAAEVLEMHLANVVRTSEPWRTAADPNQLNGQRRDADKPDLLIEGRRLTCTAPRATQDELARYLRACAVGGFAQISVDCRFLTLADELAERLGISWQYVETAADPADELSPPDVETPVVRAVNTVDGFSMVGLATLSQREVQLVLDSIRRDGRSSMLQAPKVTLFSGQRASIHDVTQRPFVIGVRQIAGGGQEPKVVVVEEGFKIALRATTTGESRVRLNTRFSVSELGDKHTVSTALGGEAAEIEIPQVKRCRIDVAAEVDDGESLLIGCVPSYDKARSFYVLFTAGSIAE